MASSKKPHFLGVFINIFDDRGRTAAGSINNIEKALYYRNDMIVLLEPNHYLHSKNSFQNVAKAVLSILVNAGYRSSLS